MKMKTVLLGIASITFVATVPHALAIGDCHQAVLNGTWFGTAFGVADGNVGVSQCQFKIQDGKLIPAQSYCKSTVPGTNQSKRYLVEPGTAKLTKSCDITVFYKPAQSNGKGKIEGAINHGHDTFTGTVIVAGANVAGTATFVKK